MELLKEHLFGNCKYSLGNLEPLCKLAPNTVQLCLAAIGNLIPGEVQRNVAIFDGATIFF